MVQDILVNKLFSAPLTQAVILYILDCFTGFSKKDAEALKLADFESGELGPPP